MIGLVLVALSWPVPDRRDAAVAAALEKRLGARSVVSCADRPGANWSCSVQMLDQPRNSCVLAQATAARGGRVLAKATASCKIVKREQEDVTEVGPDVFATPAAGYGNEVERR